MHTLSTREATGVFDPGNPGQRTEVYYAGWPGQYASFYTNEVPTTATVNLGGAIAIPLYARARPAGLLGAGVASWPLWMQVGGILGLSALAYYGTKKLRRQGLLGGTRRRRRRR